jgi:micrococcal nuclease
VAHVHCDGVDANTAQVRAGMAWAFTRYLKDAAIAEAERMARNDRRGLWADQHPVAPWVWREARRQDRFNSPLP